MVEVKLRNTVTPIGMIISYGKVYIDGTITLVNHEKIVIQDDLLCVPYEFKLDDVEYASSPREN